MGIVEVFTRPEQHPVTRILGWAVRYRAELAVTTVLVAVFLLLRNGVGPEAATVIVIVTTAVMFVVPPSRRYLTRRMWCVYSRHRARAAFVQTRTMTYDGRMPFLYWSRPSTVGERIRVWLPAGMEVKDLEGVCPELAVACWARSARVEPSRRHAHLVVIEIVRRDPLATSSVIAPAVLHGVPDVDPHPEGGQVVPLPSRSNLPAPAADDTPRTRTKGNRATARPRDREEVDEPAVTGFGGVDVSDYV
ncbi:hypothetical protein Psed_5226 [Pseudonocardia dioxanivorans CB1190]|uniref:Uncharacterized protein n=1 Tax=Pseudonocardia dioxanivorans (strain ATCC 55486 / DSM 44775 / JCM 13855 / CB1190) TaxID=675635 RepID=F4CTD7_PSEUX|nr:hypothetical protein [Pseudonocardia dioxanivorans]AEA27362.1 hypothetical protein Psed_5226 [Pseudonocardia dioxanivorans CB1190]